MASIRTAPKLRFPEFSDNWRSAYLCEFSKIYQPRTIPQSVFTADGFPVFGANGVIGHYSEYNHETPQIAVACRGNTSGKVNFTKEKSWITGNAMVINTDEYKDSINKVFLFFLLQNDNLNYLISGSGQPQITQDDFIKHKIKIPALAEQQKIADCLTAMDEAIESQQAKLEQLQSYKKGLLQQLFSQSLRFSGFIGDWEAKKLGEVGNTYTGLSGKTKENFGHGDGMFVTYMNVFSNTFSSINQLDKVEISEGEKQNTLKKGDILFTTSSETPHEVGMSSCWNHDLENVYLNSFCFGYRLNKKEDFSPEFIAYNLRNSKTRKKISILAQGSTRFNLSKTELMKMTVGFPSLPEQQKIADCLSTLDEVIELEAKKLELLRQYKKGLLQQLFV